MIEYNKGTIATTVITSNKKGNLTIYAFDKGQKINEHSDPFETKVQVLEGSGIIRIAQKEFTINEGECLTMPANTPHDIEAPQRFKLLMTMMKS